MASVALDPWLQGTTTNPVVDAAGKILLLQAEAGDAEAQFLLASHFEREGPEEDARAWLRRAAMSGHLEARTALGAHLLSREPYAVQEGIDWTSSAANDGSGEAMHLVSVLAGSGYGMKADWRLAVAYLHRAAELGYAPAQAELRFLAGGPQGDGSDNRESHDWTALAYRVDLRVWLSVPEPRPLSFAPRIAVIEDFAAPSVCDWLIAKARPMMNRAKAYQAGELRTSQVRTNADTHFDLRHSDLVLLLMRQRMAAISGVALAGFEATSVLHYAPGQYYAPHYDFFSDDTPDSARQFEGSQRVVTFLTYLTDGYEAGETEFTRLKLRYKGRKGDALFWWNVDRNAAPDQQTLHAGTAPTSGEKWVLSQWIQTCSKRS